jgi:hypothetical protein
MPISQITNNSVSPSAAIDQTKVSGLSTIVDSTAFNIAVLGFKMAVNDGLTVFNLVDGIVDEFNSSTGVASSPGGTYNSPGPSGFYSNQATNPFTASYTTTTVTGPGAPRGAAQGPYQTYGSFTTPPSGTSSVQAYVFGAGGGGAGQGGSPSLYNFGVGGGGGFAYGAIAVTGSQVLRLGIGQGANDTGLGGQNGGSTPSPSPSQTVMGGGGLVGVFSVNYSSLSAPTAYVVAGSGGGGASSVFSGGLGQYGGANGGGGGGLQGRRGGDQSVSDGTAAGPYTFPANGNPGSISGGGGSQSAGGAAGSGPAATGTAGSLFTGGPPGGGAGYYGGGGQGNSPGSVGSRGNGSGGGGSSYYGHPSVTGGTTTASQPGPSGAPVSGGATSPYYSAGIGVGGTGPGTPAPGNLSGGNGYIVLAWNEISTATATITSATFTATAVPTRARLVVFQDNISPDTATINTDLVASVSRDGGTTYTTVTLTDAGYITGASGQRILTGSATISSQPSGTSMKWRLVAQTKGQKIHGVSLQWT